MLMQTDLNPTIPRYVRPQEVKCRRMLDEAAAHLERSARLLAGSDSAHGEALTSSLDAIRQAFRALLEWHSLPPCEDAMLAELDRPAVRLASMLRTCGDRALPVEAMASSLQGGMGVDVAVREAARTSYYTARNTLLTVLGELPERVGRAARASVRNAQALRVAQATPVATASSERAVMQRSTAADVQRPSALGELIS